MLLVAICGVFGGYAQTPPARIWTHPEAWPFWRSTITTIEPADSVDVAELSKKHFWRASAEVFGFNMGLWAFDRYVKDAFFAKISFSSIGENFKHGFEWDDDNLVTNMFAHPYTGNLYFNAGRSNGYNFWQSGLYAVAGSFMWEFFMENEHPSLNDFIATPVGGAAIGEVFYRTSDLMIDNRTHGWNRAGREIGVFLLNPVRGFNRLITGRMWKHADTPGRRFGLPPVTIEVSAGMRTLVFNGDSKWYSWGGGLRFYAEYGDRFAPHSNSPYDYFSFLAEANFNKSQPLLDRIEIKGRLFGRELLDRDDKSLSIGMYQHFDFFDSDTITRHQPASRERPCVVPYKFGTPASFGVGLMSRITKGKKWNLNTFLHVNAVALGGVLSDFYRYYHRNYNWASGFAVKAGLNWMLSDKFNIEWDNQYYHLWTWDGYKGDAGWTLKMNGQPMNVMGDRSVADFNHMETRINYKIWKHLWATASLDWYHRSTFYKNWKDFEDYGIVTRNRHPVIDSNQVALNLMLTYKF